MKSRAPLILMEQMVMLLVFALAAALCMQAFVKSDQMSQRSEARDQALTQAQTVAETVRHCKGDMARAAELLGGDSYGGDGDSLTLSYDEDWAPAQGTMRYMLGISRQDSGVDGLGKAQVWIVETAGDGPEELVRFDVAWQEEVGADAG